MNNPHGAVNSWPRMLGLCPLLVVDLKALDALIFGIALLIALLFTNTAMALLRRWLAEQQRLLATVLLAALSTGIIDLLLQALCYQHAQTLHGYLPLLVIAPLLFYRSDTSKPINLRRALLESLLPGSAFACALAIAALIRAVLPNEIAIAAGLVCGALLSVIANKMSPPNMGKETFPTPRTRARVTGPVR